MLSGLLGPSIVNRPTIIEVHGINWNDFNRDLTNLYETTVMTKYMFRRINWQRFETDKFFLVELTFLLNKLLQLKLTYTPKRDLMALLTKLRTETYIKDTINRDNGPRLNEGIIKARFKLKPFDSQYQFLRAYFIRKNAYHLKGLLLHGVAGSGKTLNGIMLTTAIGKGKTVVFSPLKVIYSVWHDTLTNDKYWNGDKAKPRVWNERDNQKIDPDADYYLFSHESLSSGDLLKQIELIRSFNKGNVDFKLIIDEIHNFNDLKSKRTVSLIDLVDTVPFTDVLPMSGTPFKAQGKEAYTVFAIIDPFFKGNARKRFSDAYGRSRDRLNELLAHRIGESKFTVESLSTMDKRPDPITVKVEVPHPERYTLKYIRNSMLHYIKDRVQYYETNMDSFMNYYHSVIERYSDYIKGDRKEEEALKNYLNIVNRFRKYGYNNFTDAELAAACKVQETKIEDFLPPRERKDFRSTKSVVKYVGLKIRGEALGNVLGRARIDAVQALVEHANLDAYINSAPAKTLIFTDYNDVLDECDKHLRVLGFTPVIINGMTDNVDDDIKAFASDYKLNPLITTFKSLKEGYPLVMANQILLMNAPWRSYILEQTLARVHREGQKNETKFVLFELDTGNEENVTSRSIDILEWSAKQVEELMGSTFGDQAELAGVAGLEDYLTLMEDPISTVPMRRHSVMELF